MRNEESFLALEYLIGELAVRAMRGGNGDYGGPRVSFARRCL